MSKCLHNYIEIKVHCKIKKVLCRYLVSSGLFLPNFNIGAFFRIPVILNMRMKINEIYTFFS